MIGSVKKVVGKVSIFKQIQWNDTKATSTINFTVMNETKNNAFQLNHGQVEDYFVKIPDFPATKQCGWK